MAHELTYLRGIVNYRGVTVTKLIGKGYSLMGMYCETPECVDEFIDFGFDSIAKGIEKGKSITVTNRNGSFLSQNTEKV